jgi:hypothetical protein
MLVFHHSNLEHTGIYRVCSNNSIFYGTVIFIEPYFHLIVWIHIIINAIEKLN